VRATAFNTLVNDAVGSKSAIHMVSVWATANTISLGQIVLNEKNDEKNHEIMAIPKLLEMLVLS